MRLALELPYGRYVKRVVFLSKNRGDGKSIGGDVSEATSSATPRQRMGVDTMDLHDRGHCVSGILVVKRPIQQGCGQGEMLEAFMCLQQELNQDQASFALERHLENPLGENWRRGGVLHQTRRSVSKAADAHLGIDGGHRNGTLEGITPVTIRGPAARWSPVYSPPMARPLKAEAPAPT